MTKAELSAAMVGGKSQRVVANQLGVSQTTVRHWARKYDLKFNGRSGPRRKSTQPRYCKACNKLLVYPAQRQNIYCSLQCMADYRWSVIKAEIVRTGVVKGTTTMCCAKRYLRETVGEKCAVCGRARWQKQQIPLELDHINGNSTDHRVINLRLICGNCGMLLPTYKGRNRGSGRHKRRARYRAGKSY